MTVIAILSYGKMVKSMNNTFTDNLLTAISVLITDYAYQKDWYAPTDEVEPEEVDELVFVKFSTF